MSNESVRLLCELSDPPGVPTGEKPVRDYLRAKYEPLADEILCDNLGGIFAVKKSARADAPRLMMAGHMDEVGFMVNSVTPNGMLKIQKLGGVADRSLLSQRVQVHVGGEAIPGIIVARGSDPSRNEQTDIDSVVVDVGADSAEQVFSWKIFPGQHVTFDTRARVMQDGKKILGKAWDDRVGCALACDTMLALRDEALGCELVCGGTVQEEGGRRGAAVAAHLVQPDLFLALEGPLANDIGGDPAAFGRLGDGVLFRVIDRELKLAPKLRDYFLDLAHSCNIRYQFYRSLGGTDAGIIETTGNGVLSAVIAIPVRNRHASESVIHIEDYEAAKEFLLEFTRRFDRSVYTSLLPHTA